VAGGNLYIFTTGGEFILDLGVFPREMDLFGAEAAWRISPWLAVVEDVLQRTIDWASIILQLNDYSYMQMPLDVLEDYFRDGEEARVLEVLEVEAEAQLLVEQVSSE
jgi:hypothetical protein